ncbi:short-chain dehydrogenase [Penicillium macrosclerotiorum]|uniref:short-chain dehydrogenase n=1 Tax=Penicillium macrosclerotiorum TaxID=303699 RepID=UPI002548D1CA|nr:short-chain dehydrogenase [Penicillium macrosclerotiorum]KAJ5669214.1 short-chain dehydrogenase [Penicillium macrosclerotiorum]
MTDGTVLLTGANGSLAIPAIQHLLANYPKHQAVLTVRNPSASDPNTQKLHAILKEFQDRVSVRALDLSDLSSVRTFATTLAADINSGSLPPLTSIICNAYYWNLSTAPEFTGDGFEKTFQVNHLAHAILVQQLLESFGPASNSSEVPSARRGRIVVFGSDTIFPGQSNLEKYPPHLPGNLNDLAKPTPETDGDHMGHGFLRYALSKLAIVTWMYAMNEHFQKPENAPLREIKVVAINPGNLSDSRALRTNTPWMLRTLSRFVIRPFRPVLRLMDPTMRTAAAAGVDVVKLAVDEQFDGASGYFTLLEKSEGPPESRDRDKQAALWEKTTEWSSK